VERQAERKAFSNHLGFGERAIRRKDPAPPVDPGGEGPFHLSEEGWTAVRKGIVAERRECNPVDFGLLAEQYRLGEQDNVPAGQIDFAVIGAAAGDPASQAPMLLIDILHRQIKDDQGSDRTVREGREEPAQPIELGRLPTQAVPDIDGQDAMAARKVGGQDATVQTSANENSD